MGEIDLIIKRIRDRRLELNLSYQDIADATGLSKSTIQRYETGGIKKVPVNQIEELAKALHTSPSYLMGWDQNNPPQLSEDEQHLLNVFNKLNSEGRKQAIINLKNLTFGPEVSLISYEEAVKDALLNLLPGMKENGQKIAKEKRIINNREKSIHREIKNQTKPNKP